MNRAARSIRIALTLVALWAIVAVSAGCAAKTPQPATLEKPAAKPATTFPVTVTDDANRAVKIAEKPQRIVSLAPANTEILFAIGAGDRVVGVTSYDDYPSRVVKIAKVGDFAGPNIEAVAAARPDLIVATTGVQADVIAKLEALGATVIAIDPTTLAGLYEDIKEVGQATGEFANAVDLVDNIEASVDRVQEAVSSEPSATAFVEIGQNPLFTAGKGTLIDELVTVAGGRNVVTQTGYLPYSVEQLVRADPQVYMATKGSMSDPSQLEQRAGFAGLSAVKNDRVVVLDDNLVSRPGPRVVLGLEQIARALHPEAFSE